MGCVDNHVKSCISRRWKLCDVLRADDDEELIVAANQSISHSSSFFDDGGASF